jgi:hypothetical protein
MIATLTSTRLELNFEASLHQLTVMYGGKTMILDGKNARAAIQAVRNTLSSCKRVIVDELTIELINSTGINIARKLMIYLTANSVISETSLTLYLAA